jgi:E3 ubiquitin-protein ligase UBR4
MELLVAGKIVKLDLPVSDVYEQVWARSAQGQGYGEGGAGSPLVVVYRLQGLDGEATEPIFESLDEGLGRGDGPGGRVCDRGGRGRGRRARGDARHP